MTPEKDPRRFERTSTAVGGSASGIRGSLEDEQAQLVREYRVYDGTSLDYALKVEGAPRLFLEAKAVGKARSAGARK
jgi:hypothetical protein